MMPSTSIFQSSIFGAPTRLEPTTHRVARRYWSSAHHADLRSTHVMKGEQRETWPCQRHKQIWPVGTKNLGHLFEEELLVLGVLEVVLLR
jgi:hypothetical protein